MPLRGSIPGSTIATTPSAVLTTTFGGYTSGAKHALERRLDQVGPEQSVTYASKRV